MWCTVPPGAAVGVVVRGRVCVVGVDCVAVYCGRWSSGFRLLFVYFDCLCFVHSFIFVLFLFMSYPSVVTSQVASAWFFSFPHLDKVVEVVFPFLHWPCNALLAIVVDIGPDSTSLLLLVHLHLLCTAILVASLHFSFRCIPSENEMMNVFIFSSDSRVLRLTCSIQSSSSSSDPLVSSSVSLS